MAAREMTDKLWYNHTIEFYATISKNELNLYVWLCKKIYRIKCIINRKIPSCILEYVFICFAGTL